MSQVKDSSCLIIHPSNQYTRTCMQSCSVFAVQKCKTEPEWSSQWQIKRPPPPLLFWVKKKKSQKKEKPAGQAKQPSSPFPAEFKVWIHHCQQHWKYLKEVSCAHHLQCTCVSISDIPLVTTTILICTLSHYNSTKSTKISIVKIRVVAAWNNQRG